MSPFQCLKAVSFVVSIFMTVYFGFDKSPIFSTPTWIFLFFIFWVVSFCFHLFSHHLRGRFGKFFWRFCSFLLFILGLLLLSFTRLALQFGLAEFYSFLGVGVLILDGLGEMVGSRMMPAGSDSTNSGSWRDFINLSPERDSVGDGSNEPAAEILPAQLPPQPCSNEPATRPTLPLPAREESPVPSISSQGDSWISGYYGNRGEAASSGAAQEAGTSAAAPHPHPEETQNEAPPLAQEALPQQLNAPSVLQLRRKVDHFTSSFNRISMRSDYWLGLYEKLQFGESSPARRAQILEGMRIISSLQGEDKPRSGKKAGDALIRFIQEWDQQQD